MKKRVVITGMGLITPCGKGWQPYVDAVYNGVSHIKPMSRFSVNGFISNLAGEIPDFDPMEFIKKRKALKVMSREIQFAIAASHLAILDSNIRLEEENLDMFGVSLGTGIVNYDLDEIGISVINARDEHGRFQLKKFGQDGIRSLFPLCLLKYLPNMPASHISIEHNLKGSNNTITTSSAAGALAIGEAFRIIERGDAYCMLAGGTDSKINGMGISHFHLLGLLASRSRLKKHGYCPFDIGRDGIVVGEGAGLLLLEELKHAQDRGASIYAELCGYGSSSGNGTYPHGFEDPVGKDLAMTRAIADAGMSPEEIDFVLAHGSGIPMEDVLEARAIQSVFKERTSAIPVTAVKPVTGHLVYGSAGVELAAGIAAFSRNRIPPVINLRQPDPKCDLLLISNKSKETRVQSFLFNSFGFGGQNASVVVKKYEK